MTESSSRKATRIARVAVVVAAVTAAGIGVAAFILSFSALWDIATRVWPNRSLSWLGPAVVDCTILQATVSLLAVAKSSNHGARRYFWALLIGAAITSIAGNALHAVIPAYQALPPWTAALIATIPPVFLLLSTHSVVVLVRLQQHHTPEDQVAVAVRGGAVRVEEAESGVSPAPPSGTLFDEGHTADLDLDIDPDRELERVASELRARHRLETPSQRIELVLEHYLRSGSSATWRELGEAGGVHATTAKKIVEAFDSMSRVVPAT